VKTKYGPGPHVAIPRLTAFLIDGISLTPTERGHVMQCQVCTHLMRIAASEELKQRRNTVLPSQKNEPINKHLPPE
jgi:hypothetical protein